MPIIANTRQEYLNSLMKPINDAINMQIRNIQMAKGSDAIIAGQSRDILGANPQNAPFEIQSALTNINAKLGELQNEYSQTVSYASQGQALTQGMQNRAGLFGPSFGQEQRQAFSFGGKSKRRRAKRNNRKTRKYL